MHGGACFDELHLKLWQRVFHAIKPERAMAAETDIPSPSTANTPNSLKVGIYLHEAGLAHQRHPVDLGAGEQKRPEYLKISERQIPAIVDHEAGLTVFESGARFFRT